MCHCRGRDPSLGSPPPLFRGKWVNVNKQEEQNPLIRSRYVAFEVNTCRGDSLFATTLPLEALRCHCYLRPPALGLAVREGKS